MKPTDRRNAGRKIDDRCVLVALLGLSLAMAFVVHPAVSLLGLPLGLCAVAYAGGWRMLRRLTLAGLPFILLMWVFTPLFAQGPKFVLEQLPLVSLSLAGVKTAALITGKWASLTLFMAALMTLLPPVRLAEAAQALGLPAPLVTVFGLSLRYIDTLADELARTSEAASLRGFVRGMSVRGVRDAGRLAASVFVRAVFRAERVHEAMLLRGAGAQAIAAGESRPAVVSLAFAACSLSMGLGLVLLDRLYWA